MEKKILIVLGVFAAVLLLVGLQGKITGNAFAYSAPRSCMDSDGDNLYLQGKGVYKGMSSPKPVSFTDSCINAKYLLEHYCEGIYHKARTVPCQCENGVCKK